MSDAGTSSESPLQILVVEDSPTCQAVIEHQLRTGMAVPIDVKLVGDVSSAFGAIAANRFDLILSDYSLPDRSGLDLLQTLRDRGDATPLIMFTGNGDEALAVSALRQGALDYVVKQIGFECTLPVVIRRALQRLADDAADTEARRRLTQHARHLEQQADEQSLVLRRALQESEALQRVSRALAASRKLKSAMDMVTQAAAELVHAQAVAVLVRAGDELVLASGWGSVRMVPGSKSQKALENLTEGYRETAMTSLRSESNEIGILWAGRARFEPFSPHELELLAVLADLTSLAITNVRAHEQVRLLTETVARAGASSRGGDTRTPNVQAPPSPPAAARAPERPVGVAVSAATLAVPSFPPALARLLELCENETTTPEAIEKALRFDQALTAKAMQLASAASINRTNRIENLHDAVLVLGMRGIRNLAFAQFTRRLLVPTRLGDRLLWQQSLLVAFGLQLLVEQREPPAANDAFLCGLLHNVGALALAVTYPDAYANVLDLAVGEGVRFETAEERMFARSGTSVTTELMAPWNLPVRIRRALTSRGHAPDLLGTGLRWAAATAFRQNEFWRELLGARPEPAWIAEDVARAGAGLQLPGVDLAKVGQDVAARATAVGQLFA